MESLLDLGPFSVSLSVLDLKASRAFYEALGFEVIDGAEEQRWLMMRSGDARIGLFQGMRETSLLTFHPPDVRAVQTALRAQGMILAKEADGESGPGHIVVKDPDGNLLLLDQF